MLPAGPSPRIPFVHGGHTLVVPRHAPRALPAPLESVTALTRLRHGWLVAGRSSGMATVTRLDAALDPVWTRPGAGQLAVDSRGSSAYFTKSNQTGRPGHLDLVTARGGLLRRWTIPSPQVARPVGVGSRGSVVYNLTGSSGQRRGSWTTGPGGTRSAPRRLPLYLAEAARGHLVAGQLQHGCQVVLRDEAELWRRCDGFKLAGFSPDGRYLAAWHTATGGEFESAYVLDARTGRVVTSTSVGRPTAFHALPSGAIAWEDSRHLLLAFVDSRSVDWELLRLGLDGRIARTTGAVRAPRPESAFVLASGR
ncbi:MAG: hypothetical protein JWO76_604 [Nocardioides sp.]|nr:hypothetical protein [Nocardioides sp.]